MMIDGIPNRPFYFHQKDIIGPYNHGIHQWIAQQYLKNGSSLSILPWTHPAFQEYFVASSKNHQAPQMRTGKRWESFWNQGWNPLCSIQIVWAPVISWLCRSWHTYPFNLYIYIYYIRIYIIYIYIFILYYMLYIIYIIYIIYTYAYDFTYYKHVYKRIYICVMTQRM